MSENSAFSAIKTERVTDTIYELLRERIIAGGLEPGSKINVEEVARQLDVSRTPVHEALTVLATDGLVEVRPRRGTFVTEFELGDYAETLAIRRALEMLACETICDHVGDSDVDELEALIGEMQDVARGDGDAAEAARRHDAMNLEFHLRLVHLSGNRRLAAMYEDLRAHLRIARAHVNAHDWLSRLDVETREHARIAAALAERDAEELKNALERHLTRSAASLIDDVTRRERGERTRSSR